MLFFIGGLLGLLLLILLLVQLPAVQTWLTGKLTDSFAKQWGTEVHIGKVNIHFLETASLEDIYLEDQRGDTLLYAEYLKADIGAFALAAKSITVDEIRLENAFINLYRNADSANFNYQFIVDSFLQPDTVADTTSGGFSFDLHQVNLRNIRLRMQDDSAKTDLLVRLPSLSTDIETLGLESSHIIIDDFQVNELSGYFRAVASLPEPDQTTADTVVNPAAPLDSAWINPTGFRYTVNNFEIIKSNFAYQADTSSTKGVLNFANLAFDSLNVDIENFYLGTDTLRLQLAALAAKETNSGFLLRETKAETVLEGSLLSFTLDVFQTEYSLIEEKIQLAGINIDPTLEPSAMLRELEATVQLNDAVLGMPDVLYFLPELDSMPHLSRLQPVINASMATENGTLLIEKLTLNAEDQLLFAAHGQIENLDDPDNMRFDLVIEQLQTTAAYLQSFSPTQGSLPPELTKTGNLNLTAQLKGSTENAELVARLNSGPGRIFTRLNYTAPRPNNFLLTGSLSTANFNVKPFVGDSLGLSTVTLHSQFKVRGLGEQLNVNQFSLLVDSITYNNYTYKALALEGHLIDSVLEAALAYNDPFLAMNIGLKSDLKDSLPLLALDGRIDHANLLRLNLMADSVALSTQFKGNFQGSTADDLQGKFEMRDTEVVRGMHAYTMDSLIFAAGTRPNGEREITLLTDFIRMDLTGRYLFEELPRAIDQCVNYYCAAYDIKGEKSPTAQELVLDVKLIDEPVILKAFVPEFNLQHPLDLHLEFRNAEHSFDMDLVAPGISYDTFAIKNLEIRARTVDQNLSFAITTTDFTIGEAIDIPTIDLEGGWQKDSLNFKLALAPPADSSHLTLAGGLRFYSDTLGLQLTNTRIKVKGREFNLSENAELRYAPEYLFIRNFDLRHNKQSLRMLTSQEKSDDPLLNISIEGFQIGDFLDIFGYAEYKVQASFDGEVSLTQPLNLKAVESDLTLANILIDSIPIGDMQLRLEKLPNNDRLATQLSLQGPDNQLSLDGYYNMADSADAIALELNIASFNLTPWDVFTAGFVSDLQGILKGKLAFKGTTQQPVALGQLQLLNQAQLRLDMTGARYAVGSEPIIFEEQKIVFNNFTLKDSLNHPLRLDGEIRHTYLTNYYFDLRLKAEKFQLVDKAYTLREPFYGKLGVDVNSTIRGPIENLAVNGKIKITDNTNFTMVMLDAEDMVAEKDYINWVNTNAFAAYDTTQINLPDSLRQTMRLSGFTLNGRVDVPTSARFKVIVDPKTGDFLELRGRADDLRINMNPLTGIDLQGNYEVVDGRYRLSFMELIQKNFNVQSGSSVKFNGDPYSAELDITAVYTTEVSRYPLIQDFGVSASEAAAAKRKEPTDVLLTMRGTLEAPEFSFDILIPESGIATSSSAVQQQLNMIKADETKLFKQVFGLIVLNRFIPEEPSLAEGGNANDAVNARINESLSQFLTGQLGALTEDYLGVELEIELDDQQSGGGANNRDLTVSLSRSFFNESVEVKVGGTTGLGGSTASPGGSSDGNFAGNFEILYHINDQGNLNLKIFQRNERNYLSNELYSRSGVALAYSKMFDHLADLFGSDSHKGEMLSSDGPVPIDKE